MSIVMRKGIVLIFGLIAIIFFIVLSCADSLKPDAVPENKRIKRISQVLPNAGGVANVTDFKYDLNNNLMSLRSYQTPDSMSAVTSTTFFSRDAGNQVVKVSRFFNNMNREEYTYIYNQAGQVVNLNYKAGPNDMYFMLFQYNGTTPETSTRSFSFSSISFEQKISYHFNGDNLSSALYKTTVGKNLSTVTESTSTFTFDNKINPFYKMPVIPAPNGPAKPSAGNFDYVTYSGGLQNLLYLSRNNVISETIGGSTEITYTYTYSSDNLPVNRVTMKKSTSQTQPAIQETLEFDYEAY